MNTDIMLTIAVPTYNRCGLLRHTLDSILEQSDEQIEIIVSDNASTDDTELMMREYCKKHNIRYYRNSKNLGADRNFLNCLKMAKGKYVHLLSDDDILLPGAVVKILSLIEKEKPDYINLNSITYSTEVYDPEEYKPPRIELEKDLITNDKKLYMGFLGVYITYVSATIIKRELFLKIEWPEKYIDTHFLHAHLLLDMLADENSKVIITKDAYLAAKSNNSGGFNLYEVWIKQYKSLLLDTAIRDGCDYKQMEEMYVSDVTGFIRDSILKYSVTENEYDMEHKWLIFKYTYMYPKVWLKTYPYVILPRPILSMIYRWKRRKRRKPQLREHYSNDKIANRRGH